MIESAPFYVPTVESETGLCSFFNVCRGNCSAKLHVFEIFRTWLNGILGGITFCGINDSAYFYTFSVVFVVYHIRAIYLNCMTDLDVNW